MAEPQFTAGQQVHYFPDISQDRKSGGLFEVVKLLPLESHGLQYRIRNAAGVERVVSERQLEVVAADGR